MSCRRLIIIAFTTKAQTIFHEDFENPDSVVSSGNPGWNLYSKAQTSGVFCDSSSAQPNDSSVLTTLSFSTVGAFRVLLKFNCIATNEYMKGYVEISADGGITWSKLTENEFLSNPYPFAPFEYYSSMYWLPGLSFYGPDNSFWKPQLFDLSGLCSNQPGVMVRFNNLNNDTNPFHIIGGWFIDDLKVDGFPYSITSTSSCNNDGTATMTPYYGSAPYTYQWNSSPAQTTTTATGLPYGMYTCIVTDAGGTSYTDSIKVKSNIEVISYFQHPTCGGMSDGSISAYVISANGPYNYSWSNGAVTNSIANLPVGTYTLYVTDAVACVYQETFVLDCGYNAGNLVLSQTPSGCNDSTGTGTVQSFNPAVPPFTYEWSTVPIQTTQTATGLPGLHYYQVKVKDANNDSAYSGIYVPFNDTVFASATYTPTACNGSTGTATANPIGGVAPYSYLWNTLPLQTTDSITGLGNATYTLTVTDANGCTDDVTFSIPNNVTMSASVSSPGSQCGLPNAVGNSFVSGGTPPYTYSWSTVPVQTTANATGLSASSYHVDITDSSGCMVTKYLYVQYLSSMFLNISYSSMFCNCVNTNVTVISGTPPYTYLWDDGQTTATDTCVTVGWNYVRVTDATGCVAVKGIYITYPANCFIDVVGDVFADLNYNCVKDPGEYNIANVGLSLVSANYAYSTYTNNAGHYAFHVLNDVYTLTQYVPAHWNQLCPYSPGTYTINVPPGTIDTINIADSADNYFDDAIIYNCWSSPNTRGFNTTYYTNIRNNGTTLLSGDLVVTHDSDMAYINANPSAGYNVTTRTVTWAYSNLIPGAVRNFSFYSLIPPATPLGSLLLDTAYVTPILTDTNPADNYCNYIGTVNGSYDPNNKTVLPDGAIHKDSLVHLYTINFQNTGNSPAVRVIVEDTLDANLDITTISDMISSHAFSIDTTTAPVVKFIFDNINLPDSGYNEMLSHGFVTFKIKHKSGLASGAEIKNTGYIYFDFNAPVVTNTVINTLYDPNGIDEHYKVALHIFPNPTHDEINIRLAVIGGNGRHGQPVGNVLLTLCDVTGRAIKIIPFFNTSASDAAKLNVKSISKGIYFLKATDANGLLIASGKVVVN